jgi:drug/metabolite transporter (DMT)-like permease
MLTSLTPIFTMVLSFCFNGEKFKVQEIFFTIITLSAVTAISIGMTFDNSKSLDDDKLSL